MTTLADILRGQIAQQGPMTIADYMTQCLLHPQHGYYTTQDPLGRDFITSPEISQMFGELIGLAIAQAWRDQGAPGRITLAELGPGRGTLMADILRATQKIPGFHDAASVHFVEASPTLREKQAQVVADAKWYDDITTLPHAPLFLIANEFFDALPIRQFIRHENGWTERVIGQNDGMLCFGQTSPAPLAQLAHRLDDTQIGDLIEHCPALPAIVQEMTSRIAAHGGVALIIDYGDWRSLGDTLQAMQNGKAVDPLAAPGMADLTAHVDFEAIAQAATPAQHSKLTTQGVFLERLGITNRAQQLATILQGDALTAHIAAHKRLTHPSEMGTLFKVMGLTPEKCSPPAGLEL
jgi:SAM-dependent MidA family methyltransferase